MRRQKVRNRHSIVKGLRKTFKKVVGLFGLQLKIRPRLRLILKLIPVSVGLLALSSQAVAYMEPKVAEVKINGQPLLVAQNSEAESQGPIEVQISQSIEAKRSPFETEMPVVGYISQGYRSYHRAIDIATDFGSPIHAVGPGVVEFAGFQADGKGNVVLVDHGDGLKTLYAHMGKIYVGVGNVVTSQSELGTVGLTGRTTGAHVHLEVYDSGNQVNPGNLLP